MCVLRRLVRLLSRKSESKEQLKRPYHLFPIHRRLPLQQCHRLAKDLFKTEVVIGLSHGALGSIFRR